jgi:glycosyltransferase 2 family protein
MSPILKKILQFFFFLGLGLFILWMVFKSQNTAFQEQCRLDGVPSDQCSLLDKLMTDFSSVNLWWILAVLTAFTVSNLCRAARWQMLLAPMGYKVKLSNSLLTILLGYFANLGFPRLGEVVRAGSLSKYEKIPLEKVMGTLVIDRLMDVVCLAAVVALAFLFEGTTLLHFLNQNQNTGTTTSGGLFQNPMVQTILGAGFLGLMLAFIFRNKLLQLPIFQKVIGMLAGFLDGFKSVFKLKNPWLFLCYSAGIWAMFYLQCLFNLWAFPPTTHLTLGAALMIFVFGTLGFIIPSPGGMGTFHALAIAGLALYGVKGGDAFSYANIAFFTVQIFYNIVSGSISLVLLPILNKKSNK